MVICILLIIYVNITKFNLSLRDEPVNNEVRFSLLIELTVRGILNFNLFYI